MDEVTNREVANNAILIRELMDKVNALQAQRSPGGIIMPQPLPGPGAATISRTEFNRMRDGMVTEIEGLKAQLAAVSDVAMEAVRILDRLAGMQE